MSGRRNKKRDTESRPWAGRIRRAALGLVAVAFMASLGLAVSRLFDPRTLPVRTVEVGGSLRNVSAERVIDAAEVHVSAGFFGADIPAIRQAVVAMPWVRDATVRRLWPDTVRVLVREQTAFAYWREVGLVNPIGERFTPPPHTYPQGLPSLAGPDGSEALVTARYVQAGKLLAPLGLQITRLELDERRAWRIWLAGGVQLLIGRDDGLRALERFAMAYGGVLAPRAFDIARVDLRYANGFAVRWKQAAGGAEHEGTSSDAEKG